MHPELLKENLSLFSDLRFDLLLFCLSLNLLFRIEFVHIILILPPIISNPPIISEEELAMTISPCSQLIIKTPVEMISEEDNKDGPITFDTFSCPEMTSIDSYISTIDHPIRSIVESLNGQPEEMHLILIKLIIQCGSDRISNHNDINLQILLFTLIKNLTASMEIPSQFFESKMNTNLFFTPSLFNPAITIFNRPKSTMIMARFLIISMFKILIDNSNDSSFYLNVLLNFLNKTLIYPELYSEFFFFTHSVLTQFINTPNEYQEVILNCSAQILMFQQTSKFMGVENNRKFRSLTFNALQLMLSAIHQALPINNLIDSLLSLIFEKEVTDVTSIVLRRYILKFRNSNIFIVKEIFTKILNSIAICKNDVKLFSNVLEKLLDILYSFAKELQPQNKDLIIQAGYFNSVRNIIFLEDVSVNSIANILKLIHLSPQTEQESPFSEFAKIISKHKMTQKMYEAVLICLSNEVEKPSGIINAKAIPLILPFLKTEKFCFIFLQQIYKIVENSIPDSIVFSKSRLMSKIIEVIKPGDSNEELYDIVLKILIKVFPQITSRKDLYAFFKLFSPKENKICKHSSLLLNSLKSILLQKPQMHRAILKITSNKGSIVIPGIHPKDYNHGFLFCFNMLVTNFQEDSDGIILFKLVSRISNVYLSCILQKDKVIFSIAKNMGVMIDVNIPINEWFQLSVAFRNWGNLFIFLNGKMIGTTAISTNEWNESFTNNILFGAGTGFVECQLSRFAIFQNHPVINRDFNISDLQEIHQNSTFLLDSQSYFYDELNQKYQLNDISARNGQNRSYTFDGVLYNAISGFIMTFTYSKGLFFIISLFYQITFDDNPSESYLLELFEVLCIYINENNEVQKHLSKIKGFEIISSFLLKAIQKKNIDMNEKVSSAIFKIHQYFINDEIQISYIQSLLLNFNLLKESKIEIQHNLFSQLLEFCKLSPMIYKIKLKPRIIISIIKKFNSDQRDGAKEILEILCQLLIESMTQHVEKEDVLSFLSLMKMSCESQSSMEKYLKVLYQFVTKEPKNQDLVGSVLMTTDWIVMYYKFPYIQKFLSNSFARLNLPVFSRFFLKNIELASKRTEIENDKLLIKLCFYMTGIELTDDLHDNLSETEKDPKESILLKLINKQDDWNLSEWILPACISAALYFLLNRRALSFH